MAGPVSPLPASPPYQEPGVVLVNKKLSPPRFFVRGAESDSSDSEDESVHVECSTLQAQKIQATVKFTNVIAPKVSKIRQNIELDREKSRFKNTSAILVFAPSSPCYFSNNHQARYSPISIKVHDKVIHRFSLYQSEGSTKATSLDGRLIVTLEPLTPDEVAGLKGPAKRLFFDLPCQPATVHIDQNRVDVGVIMKVSEIRVTLSNAED